MKKMREGDLEYFKKYYRMSPEQFDFIVGLLGPDLQKQYIVREPICPAPAERLAATLGYVNCKI